VAAMAAAEDRNVLVLASTNNANGNEVAVFALKNTSLSLQNMLPTGGNGGADGNGGILQFNSQLGAVANFGSNTVTELFRNDDSIRAGQTIKLAPGCVKPDSVALTPNSLFVVGANCAESHGLNSGGTSVVHLADASAGQIVVGKSWAAVTLKSGSVLQLPLTKAGTLNGTSAVITLPSGANDTPLGAAFWGNILGFTPAHSVDSFAIVDQDRNVFPILGPQPAFPANAPCWVAKGPGSVWYTGNSPGNTISIFFSDGQGGTFYKSVPLLGAPTDIIVSQDNKLLAVIYVANDGSGGRIAVFGIDVYGDLSPLATSDPIAGAASFNGVAISQ